MRLVAKMAVKVGPCRLCGRELKLDCRDRPWAHKCPHGRRCESRWKLGLPSIPLCQECEQRGNDVKQV